MYLPGVDDKPCMAPFIVHAWRCTLLACIEAMAELVWALHGCIMACKHSAKKFQTQQPDDQQRATRQIDQYDPVA